MQRTALFLTGLVVALTAPPRFAHAHSAVEPLPRNEEWWQQRHRAMNQRVATAGEQVRVVFIGDLITPGGEGAGKEVWESYDAPRQALNQCLGSNRTQHVLWRLENGNPDGLKPRVAVVMIGTVNSSGEDNTVEQVANGVRTIVSRLRARLPETTVVLLATVPRVGNPGMQRGKVLQVNQIPQRLGDHRDEFFVDFGCKFLNDQGLIPHELTPDYLHLSPAGYAPWAESIEALLARLLNETPVPATGVRQSGERIGTIRGPNGNRVEAPLILQQDGTRVTGRFARGPDCVLETEDGRGTGKTYSWTVGRGCPAGSVVVYHMSGMVDVEKTMGKVITAMDGSETTAEWIARRQ